MSIRDNIQIIRGKILRAEERSGRPADSVQLMAVSKFHPEEAVREAIQSGQLLFGENRIQEAAAKFSPIFGDYPETQLHMIGSLQRNKVREAVRLVSCIQSVDRPDLLQEIEKQAAFLDKTIDILFEYHTGEESKSGYVTDDNLFSSIDLLNGMPHVRCRGLMTMAPFTDDQIIIRQSFRRLMRVRETCIRRYPNIDFATVSMGMSADFEIAVEEGSTLVRVGTAIFGART